MKVLGIIAEYNPFHYGHLFHLKQSLRLSKADYTIAVMSGQFTQRGEAAIVDKWIRARAAVACGVDLVLELPTVYAVQTAELFARGGIQLLNHTGLTTHVSFGSEIGELAPLQSIADILTVEDEEYKRLLKAYLAKGLSFPDARQRAVMGYYSGISEPAIQTVLSKSNSILAIEYLKALKNSKSKIIPLTLPRVRTSYNSTQIKKGIASATSIRKEIMENNLSHRAKEAVPEPVFNILSDSFVNGMGPVDNNSFDDFILGTLRRSSLAEIASWMDVSEGLENRIKECAQIASNIEEFITLVKTRRYVHTRLQRILIHGLLNLTTKSFKELDDVTGPKYLRILAFSRNAMPLMRRLKETAQVPILTKAAHINRYETSIQRMFAYDSLATDIYSLALSNPKMRQGGRDFTQKLIPI
ncbi:MAG: nucleotidyltransferase [Clostridiales bacterium]|nr:nucleotidyltransferase [Clostridiales bacterium]